MDVLDAMHARACTRAFLDKPVPRETVEAILEAARFAPSGVNHQPWRVAVVTGQTKIDLSAALLAARVNGEPERADYSYYAKTWEEPYKARRLACGLALYTALGIKREDAERKIKSWNLNYSFFGAPVGLLFFIDRHLEKGSWIDTGMFIQNVMLAALHFDLATCPQASIAEYPDLARKILNVPDTRLLVCGMALGFPDKTAAVNQYRTSREVITSFTNWYS